MHFMTNDFFCVLRYFVEKGFEIDIGYWNENRFEKIGFVNVSLSWLTS